MWHIFHKEITESTNLDALAGKAGDVFTADFQLAGRGRLDHKWHSSKGKNLMMSAVVDIENVAVEEVVTLPLVAGLAVVEALKLFLADVDIKLKWPNDVFVNGKKICGILCERHNARVIIGIGINVNQTTFAPEISSRATSLSLLKARVNDVIVVRDEVLKALKREVSLWRECGFKAFLPRIRAIDYLKGREISIRQRDDDIESTKGFCGGIADDGAIVINDTKFYAGEVYRIR